MTNSSTVVRALITYGIVLPLAILLGYLAVGLSPDNPTGLSRNSIIAVTIVIGILCFPLLLRWHHALLFFSWNASALVFLLPGRPELWIFMALIGFMFMLVQRALGPDLLLGQVTLILYPLLFMMVVVLVTAFSRGGIQLGSLGGETLGGRKYIYMIAATIGFIAMTSFRVPEDKARLYTGGYFLSGMSYAIGDIVHFLPWLSFLWYVFPLQAGSGFIDPGNFSIQYSGAVFRDYGITMACMSILSYMLARNGLTKILQGGLLKKSVFLAAAAGCLVGGFRGALVAILLTCFIMFLFERLYRSKYVLVVVAAVILCLPLAPFADKLPLSIQRSLSVLPYVKVSPQALASAEATTEWRLNMWKILLPQIPEYFWLGKGYQTSTSEFVTAVIAQYRGSSGDSETQMLAGDYHNGPLSVIIPFGIWGLIAWIWLLWAGTRTLYLNYRHGSSNLWSLNVFLLSYFISKIIMFVFVFGSAYSDLAGFLGILALSICLNGGVHRVMSSATPEQTSSVRSPAKLSPSF